MPFGVVAGSGSAAGAGLGGAAPGEENGAEDTIGDGETSEDAAGVGDGDRAGVGDGVGDAAGDGKASGDGAGDALIVFAAVIAGDAAAAGEAADEPTATMRTFSIWSGSNCSMTCPDAAAKMKLLC